MLIDTHAHVNFRSFKDDAKEILQRAQDNGVQVINVGSQIDTSRQAVELANQFSDGVYAVVGLHPEHTHSQYVDEEETHFKSREENFDYNVYRELAKNPKVVGIGECGLDYFRLPSEMEHGTRSIEQIKQKQKDAFIAQIKLAKELNKALVIHCRPSVGSMDAYQDILEILDQELPMLGIKDKGLGIRFEIHSFTGSLQYLQKFLDRGAYVSFNGIITFDKTGNMEQLVKMAPLDRILLETDCPYLTSIPHRGKRNEPSFVKFTAEKVAQIKNASFDEVAGTTTVNARNLFRL